MEYKELIQIAKSNGVANEKIMWKSIDNISDMLCMLKKEHPDLYFKFIREQHGILFGDHYTKEYAEWDVSNMWHKNKSGSRIEGEHWNIAQAKDATKGVTMPPGTNVYDAYVAYNAFWHDLTEQGVSDEDIIKYANAFFFHDDDSPTEGKVWKYMQAIHE